VQERLTALTADAQRLPPPDRARLLALAAEFPRVWADPATDVRTKKRIVRLLIEVIIAKVVAAPKPQIELLIHWKGGAHTQLVIPRNRTGHHRRCTDREVVAVVRDLARTLPDAQIARVQNRLGYRTGAGNSWTQTRVISLRSYHQIAAFDRAVDRARLLTIAEASKVLGVSAATVRRMITMGLLPATQPVVHAPWAIREDDFQTDGVQRVIDAIKQGGALPRTEVPGQLTFENSTT
jgi:excisionase family DNA binding protein